MLPRIPAPGRSTAGRALAPPTALLAVGGLAALALGIGPPVAHAATTPAAAPCTVQVRYTTTAPVRATARTTRTVVVTPGRSRTRASSATRGSTSWSGRATVTAGATARVTWRISATAPARVRATVVRVCGAGATATTTATATRTATGSGVRTVTTARSVTSSATAGARSRSRSGAVGAAVAGAIRLARSRAASAATRAALVAVPSTAATAAAARADAVRRARASARSAALRALAAPAATTTPPAPPPSGSTPPATTPPPGSTTPPPGSTTPPPSTGSWWRPAKGTTWQWQLSGTVDTSVPAAVFDIDGENASAATVAALHAKGAKVICYFDAGGWENYRSDAAAFPTSVLGKTMAGWPDERWIDIRQRAVVLPLMERRIVACKDKGFDAVEPDVVDGYTNDTGFPLTAADQIAYNTALADIAHRHGLGVALKNDPEQVAALEPSFDFAIVEECYQYGECSSYTPFARAGKAVLHVEYQGDTATFCPATKALGFSSMKKRLALDAWREVCP